MKPDNMKSIQDTSTALAQHLRESMPMIADLPEESTLASFIAESLRHQFGAAATDLQPMHVTDDGHGGIDIHGVGAMSQALMKQELLSPKVAPDSALAVQVAGSHYKDMPIQHVEYCQRNKLGWCESAAIKYLSRHNKKNKLEDVKKAAHYVRLLAEIDYGVRI